MTIQMKLAVFAVALLSLNASAAERLLGATELSGIYDRDLIPVPGLCPGPGNPPIRAVQITVLRHAAELEQLEVRYGNGVWDNLPVRERFRAGSSSRWIDLKGGLRCVEFVRIVGRTTGLGRAPLALIEVRGRD